MATYTRETREAAVRLAAVVGPYAAARETAINVGTIKAWMNRARVAGRTDLGVAATTIRDEPVAMDACAPERTTNTGWLPVQDARAALEVRRRAHEHAVELARVAAAEKRLANQEAMLDTVASLLRQMRSSVTYYAGRTGEHWTIPLPYGNDQRGLAMAIKDLMATYRNEVAEQSGVNTPASVSETFKMNVLVVAERLGLDPYELEREARQLLGEMGEP